jgi:hypothetical protein
MRFECLQNWRHLPVKLRKASGITDAVSRVRTLLHIPNVRDVKFLAFVSNVLCKKNLQVISVTFIKFHES